MKTIHVILNAHIDPVWLWPWQSGLGEVLATCRSACDRMDANPDIFFTRGEAWVYEQIERTDPELFERIRKHIKAGRWEIIGGWYIQPDCNLPSAWGIQKQIELGKAYFESRFGIFPRIGFNPDSFGHSAAFPELMLAAGQDGYVFTRPSQQECAQPGRLYRWRGYENGPELIACRPQFTNSHELDVDVLNKAVEELPEGIEHAACCLGVGDHGGGPTENQIAWCRKHAGAVEGWKLEFSTFSRYFDAIRPHREKMPLFVGELQIHAIGCYSVYRAVKTGIRRAEHRLAQAATLRDNDAKTNESLTQAWKRVCFHHFHDTMCGCCVPSAYVAVNDQLGAANAAADEALQYHLRRAGDRLPPDKLQRVVTLNANDAPFDDFVEHEAWIGPWVNRWRSNYILVDEQENPIEFQLLDPESSGYGSRNDTVLPRMLFRMRLAPGEMRAVKITQAQAPAKFPSRVSFSGGMDAVSSNAGVTCRADRIAWKSTEASANASLPVQFALLRDLSDTWSHGIDRFEEEPLETARWDDPQIIDRGPLMASLIAEGTIGRSSLCAEWRVYADEPFADLRLRVHWMERWRMLKLVLPFASGIDQRTDGIMGGSLVRPNSGAERPLRDWTLLTGVNGDKLGVVCPDAYGIDATNERVRLTLLRSPMFSYHEPAPATVGRREFTDQGVQYFRFRFFRGPQASSEILERHAAALQRPPIIADATRGMPTII